MMTTFINLNNRKSKKVIFRKPGKYVAFIHNISGDFNFIIKERNVSLEIYGLFYGKKSDDFKINTFQHHVAPASSSNLFIKGVFDDESKFHYQGLIKIEKTAQKTHAYQKNQNILLSPRAFVESEPFLEILANDVFCTHGSTTGKLSEEHMYYLKSRGIEEKKARKLLIEGFLNEILWKVKDYEPHFKITN